MRRLLGIFSIKKNTPEQIYEKVQKTLQEKEQLELLEMAKARGKVKNETKTTSKSSLTR